MDLSSLLNQSWFLVKALDKTSEAFSKQLLSTMIAINMILIFNFYRFLAFFIGNYEYTSSMMIFITSYAFYKVYIISILLYFTIGSQFVVDQVQNLSRVLRHIAIDDNQKMVFDGKQKIKIKREEKNIIFHPSIFQGKYNQFSLQEI